MTKESVQTLLELVVNINFGLTDEGIDRAQKLLKAKKELEEELKKGV